LYLPINKSTEWGLIYSLKSYPLNFWYGIGANQNSSMLIVVDKLLRVYARPRSCSTCLVMCPRFRIAHMDTMPSIKTRFIFLLLLLSVPIMAATATTLLLQLIYCYNLSSITVATTTLLLQKQHMSIFQPTLWLYCSCHTHYPLLQLLQPICSPLLLFSNHQPPLSCPLQTISCLLLLSPLQVWSNLIYSYLSRSSLPSPLFLSLRISQNISFTKFEDLRKSYLLLRLSLRIS